MMGTCFRSGAHVCATASAPFAWGRHRRQPPLCTPHRPVSSRPGQQRQRQQQQRHSSSSCRASHYELLGIASESSDDEIKTAFRRVAKKLHPDVNKEEGAQERFMRINQAYTTLSDPKQRREYDSELRRPRSSQASRPQRPSNGWVEYSWVVEMTEDSDDDDDDDDDDDEDILEFLNWSAKGNNRSSSFQSSWQANDKKRRQKEAASRAQAGKQQGRGAGAAKKQAGRPRSVEISDADRMEMLSHLRPDARYNAQKVFGRTLQNLESWEQLADLLDVLDALDGGNLNAEFEDDSDDDDDGAWQSRRASGSGRRPAAATSARQPPSRGRSKATDMGLELDWETLMHDFDSGSASASKARYSQAAPTGGAGARSTPGAGRAGPGGSASRRRKDAGAGASPPRGGQAQDSTSRQPKQGSVPPTKRPVHRAPATPIADDSDDDDDDDDLDVLHELVFGSSSGRRPGGARRPRGAL